MPTQFLKSVSLVAVLFLTAAIAPSRPRQKILNINRMDTPRDMQVPRPVSHVTTTCTLR